jgi:hypothetical protein
LKYKTQASSMSEYAGITIILGVVGTLTGGFALIISGLTYYYDKPHLSIDVKRFEHTQMGNTLMINDFYIVFDVKNSGNRSTTLNELELSFVDSKNVYSTREEIQEGLYTDPIRGMIKVDIEAGKTKERTLFFNSAHFELKQIMEEIPCHLTLYHTYKAVKFNAISKRVSKK